MKKNAGFTIIELVMVVVILAVLSLIAIPNYLKSRTKTQQKEALANVRLIAAAEKIYYIEGARYLGCNCSTPVECAGGSGCNYLLKLMLNTQDWAYSVAATGTSLNSTANISATAKGNSCAYTLSSTDFNTKNYSTTSGCIN